MIHKYTKEQKEYIRNISKGRYNDEITKMFNKKFGTNLHVGQIIAFKANHRIKSGVTRRKPNPDAGLFTKEQKDFIKENVKGRTNKDLVVLVNKTFGLSITERQMNTYKKNHGLQSGVITRFKKGQTAWNKDMKGLHLGGEKGWFKKGNTPINHRPVGSERINVDGYIEIKVAEPRKWELKHRVVWEKVNGPVPRGHAVIFGDGNKLNLNLDNLILVSRAQLATLNKHGLIQNDADLTRTGIVIADMHQKISERNKR